ncbi:diguanylate cyclase domain-containing protein [Flocculibacter collagenilyticus]|uniref:diguanylate cyclase domain-containing protein n=1 Tax=Flocculibacter collagenilyticus TaxID=2744479 RepID=UPI001F347965
MEIFNREWHRLMREQDALSFVIVNPHIKTLDENSKVGFQIVAKVLEKSVLRATDLLSRFHDNEFAVGLFNLNENGTNTIIQRIYDNLDSISDELYKLNIHVSIGALNVLPNNDIDLMNIIRSAKELAEAAYKENKQGYKLEYYQCH